MQNTILEIFESISLLTRDLGAQNIPKTDFFARILRTGAENVNRFRWNLVSERETMSWENDIWKFSSRSVFLAGGIEPPKHSVLCSHPKGDFMALNFLLITPSTWKYPNIIFPYFHIHLQDFPQDNNKKQFPGKLYALKSLANEPIFRSSIFFMIPHLFTKCNENWPSFGSVNEKKTIFWEHFTLPYRFLDIRINLEMAWNPPFLI